MVKIENYSIYFILLILVFFGCSDCHSDNEKSNRENSEIKKEKQIKFKAEKFKKENAILFEFINNDTLSNLKLELDFEKYQIINGKYSNIYEFGFDEIIVKSIFNTDSNTSYILLKHNYGGGSSNLYYYLVKLNKENIKLSDFYSFKNVFEIVKYDSSKIVFRATLSKNDIEIKIQQFSWNLKNDSILVE